MGHEYTWCDYEVPGIILLRDLKEAMRLDRRTDTSMYVSTWHQITILMH
jgi:hypothetical protein